MISLSNEKYNKQKQMYCFNFYSFIQLIQLVDD